MAGIYVDVRELPDTVRKVLKELGYGRKDIKVDVATSFTIGNASGAGLKAFWVVVNIATGQHHIEWGSWGGANMFLQRNPVDLDMEPHQLPPGAIIIKGTKGQTVYAHIIAHPGNVLQLNPPQDTTLTDKEKDALAIVGGVTSGYRKDEFIRKGLGAYGPDNPFVKSLASKGLIQVTRAGMSITTKGRNMRDERRAMSAGRVAERFMGKTAQALHQDLNVQVAFYAKSDEVIPTGLGPTVVTSGVFALELGGYDLSRNVEIILQGGPTWKLSQFMIIGAQDRALEAFFAQAFRPLMPAIVARLKRDRRL